MIKTIVGYRIAQGMSEQEYESWLFDVHVPDIMANPHIDAMVFNTVLRPVQHTSDGSVPIGNDETFYRIAEMHFADEDAYANYLAWFRTHPIAPERSPAGRTDFRFYVVTEVTEVRRSDQPHARPAT